MPVIKLSILHGYVLSWTSIITIRRHFKIVKTLSTDIQSIASAFCYNYALKCRKSIIKYQKVIYIIKM